MIGSIALVTVSILCALLSIPLVKKKIGRNSYYGFRTRRTLSSDDIWYPANRFAGIAMLWWAAIAFDIGIAGLIFFNNSLALDIVMTGMALTVLIPCLISIRWVNRNFG